MSRASNPGAIANRQGRSSASEMATLVGVVNQPKASIDSIREDMPTKEDLIRVEGNIKVHVDNNTRNGSSIFF